MMVILNSFLFLIVTFFCSAKEIFTDNLSLVKFIIESISIILLILFLGIMNKRTKYGTQILGRIRGFKYFLETVEKPKLEELVMNDSEYFYNILPYTYVLGVSNKWMKKFEDIALEDPLWGFIVMEYLVIVHLIDLCVLLMHQYQHLWYQYQQGMEEVSLEEDLAVVAGGSW